MPIFPLTLHKTYLEQGFFNVTVDFDKYVRPTDGPVDLLLCHDGREHRIGATVNRTANLNGTARIRGGASSGTGFLVTSILALGSTWTCPRPTRSA
jgi:hypothetical protein